MVILYHGTDRELKYLKENSYVTKSFKDACKFGYRKAVLSNSQFVYVHIIEIQDVSFADFLKKDEKRDRAFITSQTMKVEIKSKYPIYQTPYKLKKFKLGDENGEKAKS